MQGITLVTAVTPSHLGKLKWCLPTWKIKPQFRDCKLVVFFDGFKDIEELRFIRDTWGERCELVEWTMRKAENNRERMISAFVLGASMHVSTDYFVKLDTDCYFTSEKDVFDLSDFKHELVSHRWGYTKPGWWVNKLDAWSKGEKYKGARGKGTHSSKRIISFCCLHKTAFVQEAAQLAGECLPVPSHDTYLWWLAEHVGGFSWKSKNLGKLGVGHNSRERKVREEVCARAGRCDGLIKQLRKHVQLEITTACNLSCPNCDRQCGEAPSGEHMTVEQIVRAIDEWRECKQVWNRIDILGGEPTLHKNLSAILDLLRDCQQKDAPQCKIRLTTNGTGEKVQRVIKTLPDWLKVRNSSSEKKSPRFEAVNVAPIDKGIANAAACSIPWRCGIALTRYGYFLCGAGAAICRVTGLHQGIKDFKDIDNLKDQFDICSYCGHSRSCVELTTERKISATWVRYFEQYKKAKPELSLY